MESLKTITGVLTALVVGYAGFKTCQIYFSRKKYSKFPGPPSSGILGFYLGNLPDIINCFKNKKIMNDLFSEW